MGTDSLDHPKKKKNPTQLISISERGAVRRDQSRQSFKKLRSFYSIETETLSLLSPLKGSFPSSSLPPSLSPFLSLLLSLPSCRFIFGGRVLDIHCPASVVTGKRTVQLAQIPLLTISGEQLDPRFFLVELLLVQEWSSLLEVVTVRGGKSHSRNQKLCFKDHVRSLSFPKTLKN